MTLTCNLRNFLKNIFPLLNIKTAKTKVKQLKIYKLFYFNCVILSYLDMKIENYLHVLFKQQNIMITILQTTCNKGLQIITKKAFTPVIVCLYISTRHLNYGGL